VTVSREEWEAGIARQDAAKKAADAEAARLAKESRKAYLAEQAAEIRAEQDHRMRIRDAAQDPRELEREMNEARSEAALAKEQAWQVDPADHAGRLAAAEGAAKAAKTALDIIQVRMQAAQVRALADAGNDPVRRAKATALAHADWAEAVGQAEADYEAASWEADRAAVDAARANKIMRHRIEAAEARMAEREKGEQDVLRLSNPFADPIKPVISQSQFDSIRDPALRARAAKEAQIVPDDDPPFTKADAEAVLKARGSLKRIVVTRSELAALGAEDQMWMARNAILVGD
jgi:dTMP kinase